MFFEQECIVFELLDVLYLEQSDARMHNADRNFDALSFRFEADAVLSAAGQEIRLSDNSVSYVPSNVKYKRSSDVDKLVVIHFKSFNYHSDRLQYFMPENAEKYKKLFTEILDCWNKKDISYKNECSALFSKILAEMYKDNPPFLNNKKIYDSILFMQKNCLSKEFSVKEAAKQSFVSETYFRKLFKEEIGISPKRYVINRRIDYAKALIIAGYFSVGEIADMCGYNDEKHFSTEFKKEVGVSPSKYKYNY